MSQYRVGVVTTLTGSQTVIGSGTAFLANVAIGDLFKKLGQNVIYEIAGVPSDTEITLSGPYVGSGESGMTYGITRDFTPNLELPEVWAGDKDWPYTLTKALRVIDAAFSRTAVNPTVSMVAGEDLILGDLVYFASDGKAWKADASAAASMPGAGIAAETIATLASGDILLCGSIHLHALAPGWTVGGLIYASITAGGLSQSAPSGSGEQVQVVAVATEDDVMWFNPSYVLVEIA